MSQKNRDKQDKRRRRLERRARNATRRAERKKGEAIKALCQNCETSYVPGDPSPIHRDGPCDCDAETRRRMNEFLEVRSREFEAARKLVRDPVSGEAVTENPEAFNGPRGGLGLIVCRSCYCLHDERQQATVFIEGRLVWDGCDHCLKSRESLVDFAVNQARTRWGWRPGDAVVGGVDPKFAPQKNEPVKEKGLVLAMPKKA